MSPTVAHISRELDVGVVKVAKGFLSMHHQMPHVIYIAKNGDMHRYIGTSLQDIPERGSIREVLQFHSVSSRGAEMSI